MTYIQSLEKAVKTVLYATPPCKPLKWITAKEAVRSKYTVQYDNMTIYNNSITNACSMSVISEPIV